METVLPFHYYVGCRDQTEVARLAWQAPLPVGPSCQPQFSSVYHTDLQVHECSLVPLLGSSADLLLRQMGLGRLKELEKRRQVGGA